MDQTEFVLEYLKEQYTQARQYETREAGATTFLAALADAVLGLALKDGEIRPESWWIGALLILIGSTNSWINRAHFKGCLYHTAVAGEARRALEQAITPWTVPTPTEMRNKIRADHKIGRSESDLRKNVHRALSWIPRGVIVLGVVLVSIAFWRYACAHGCTAAFLR